MWQRQIFKMSRVFATTSNQPVNAGTHHQNRYPRSGDGTRSTKTAHRARRSRRRLSHPDTESVSNASKNAIALTVFISVTPLISCGQLKLSEPPSSALYQ
jgi:hypothetical protein